jgi:hypothetical protein
MLRLKHITPSLHYSNPMNQPSEFTFRKSNCGIRSGCAVAHESWAPIAKTRVTYDTKI